MGFQKVEYEFPDEGDEGSIEIEIESSDAMEVFPDEKTNKEKAKQATKVEVEDDVDIEVVDDTPPQDRNRKPSDPPEDVTEEELQNYSEKVQQRIRHFTKGYHDERRAKESAERERAELERLARVLVEENQKLKGESGKSRAVLLKQAQRMVQGEIDKAKQEYKSAYDAGNSDALLEAEEKLAKARARQDQLARVKIPPLQEDGSEVKVDTSAQQPRQQAPTQAQKFVPDEKAVSWAEQNKWFGTNDEMTAFAYGLHNKLVREGVSPESDEYYEKINSRMRTVFPEEFEGESDRASSNRTPQKSNVVAPVSRSTSPKKVKLTRTQVAIAKRLNVPLELYAKQVAEEMRKDNG